MVRFSVASFFIKVWRPFFKGKKPSKQNASVGKPLFTKAGTKAVAPGKQHTSTLFSTQALTNKNAGSLIPGVPASVSKAIFFPVFN